MLEARAHQHEAIRALSDPADSRAWAAMACGTGKTLVSRHVAYARSHDDYGVITVFAPSKRLTQEHYESWTRDTPGGMDSLMVHSDAGGITDPDRIAQFIGKTHAGRPRVIFSTYQSAPRIQQAYKMYPDLEPLGVMVLDEAHVTASMSGQGYGLVLLDSFIPARSRISLTATPRVHTDPENDASAVTSMDDSELYGECRYELSFATAIEGFLINDFRIVIITVTDADIHRLLDGSEEAKDLPTSVLASQVSAAYAIKEFGLRSVLAFHNRTDRSRVYTATLGKVAEAVGAGRVTALSMEASTPAAQRDVMLRTLARPPQGHAVVLSSVGTISAGVDVPEVQAVQFADPRTSRVAVAQAVGRALRRAPGKVGVRQPDEKAEAAMVILPVYLPPGADAEEIVQSSRFGVVWSALAALRDFDERLDSELSRKAVTRARKASKAPVELPDRLEIRQTGTDVLPPGISSRLGSALEAHLMTLGVRRVKHTPVNKENLQRLAEEWGRLVNLEDFDGDLRYELAMEISEAAGGSIFNRHIPGPLAPLVGHVIQFADRYERRRAR